MSAPAGAVVRIYYDGVHQMLIGEGLVTPTNRTYVVIERRVQQRGKHTGRQHLTCIVHNEPPLGVTCYELCWYKRKKRTPGGHG